MRSVVLPFDVISPDIDEKAFRQQSATARTMAVAMAKGRAIAERLTEPAIIVTADTVVRMPDGSIREKPANGQEARGWLRSYRGVNPCCFTSVYALRTSDGMDVIATDSATIAFRVFSEQRIDDILADGTVMRCAGAFTMEHPLFADHIRQIWGNPETIQGLPGPFVRSHLSILSRP
jgi:septum formation protein